MIEGKKAIDKDKPCLPGHKHERVGMFTGLCGICGKQVDDEWYPTPEAKRMFKPTRNSRKGVRR